ncbi:hypothetical protein KP509_36G015200 [Ceratopteris richardii]|uniref:Uncharacterized protein n=1 Tax=Ceratopteris richardii TaxID=49495 RepID=A0A8T2QAS6_CERRI|nr:hypothetical protein KP509_36G015200 [Ceratopteris richardii]
MAVKYVNPVTKLCVIRCSRTEYEKVWAAVTFITNMRGCPLFFNLLDLSGNIRCCRSVTLEYDKAKIELLKLSSAKNQITPAQLLAASSCLEKISQLEM